MVSAVWRPLLEKREKGRTHRSIRSTFSPRYTPPVDVAHPPWALNRVPFRLASTPGSLNPHRLVIQLVFRLRLIKVVSARSRALCRSRPGTIL